MPQWLQQVVPRPSPYPSCIRSVAPRGQVARPGEGLATDQRLGGCAAFCRQSALSSIRQPATTLLSLGAAACQRIRSSARESLRGRLETRPARMSGRAPAAGLPLALYRSLLRVAKSFAAAEIPLAGVHAPSSPSLRAASATALRDGLPAVFRPQDDGAGRPKWSLDDGLQALRTLKAQLAVLRGADPEAQEGLRFWARELRTARHWGPGRGRHGPPEERAAELAVLVERAALHLTVLTEPHISLLDLEVSGGAGQDQQVSPEEELDRLALEVRSGRPELFGDMSGDLPEDLRAQQVDAINSVLFERAKFKALPIEWVYDGLSPLLLADVLRKRNGVPLALAILYQAVARRLGVPTAMCRATRHEVHEDVAGSRSATYMPPDPEVWLLCIPSGPETTGGGDALVLQPSRKGQTITLEECRRIYPKAEIGAEASREDLVKVWAAMARTVLVAHQRRGESETVASWLYQVLALDPGAEEWDFMLQPQALQRP